MSEQRSNEGVRRRESPEGRAPATAGLPIQNEHGFFEMRLESIGGLGANVAGQIFAEAAVLHAGLNGSNFASYGSEKKGSPVKVFLRFAEGDRLIRDATPIERPHVLGVFHEALLHTGAGVTGGLYENSTVIVNTRKNPEELAAAANLTTGRVGVLPALDIAVAEGSRVNMAMLGALTQACPFVAPEAVVDAVKASLGVRYPRLLEANLRTFWRGFKEVRFVELGPAREEEGPSPTAGAAEAAAARDDRDDEQPFIRTPPVLGYDTAPAGGLIPVPGNSIHKDLSASREGFLPEFYPDKCTHCAQCDLVCPDYCFVWEEGVDPRGRPAMMLVGIDYQYCKGCLKCIEACPFDALAAIAEVDGWAAAERTPHRWNGQSAVGASTSNPAAGKVE